MKKWKVLNLGHGFWPSKFKARTPFIRPTASIRGKKKKKELREKKTLSVVSYLNKMLHFALVYLAWIFKLNMWDDSILCTVIQLPQSCLYKKYALLFCLFKFIFTFSNKWKGKLIMCIYDNGILTGLELLVFLPCLL